MKIVIAGCGWLGEELGELLTRNGHLVTGTKRTEISDNGHFAVVKYDPKEDISEGVREMFLSADWIVLSFPPDRNNLEGYSQDCLKTAKLANSNAKILMISSTGVYSDDLEIALEKDAEFNSSDRILIAEKELTEFCWERLTIIRMAGLFGEDRLIVNHMSKSGKTYNGNEPVNLIHKKDAAGICAFVIEKDITGEIINACTPDHPLKKDFYTALAKSKGFAPPLFEDGKSGKIVSSEKSIALGYNYIYQKISDFM